MTTRQFITNPITIVVGSILIVTAVVLIYGYNKLGWLGGSDDWRKANNKPLRKQINCTTNAECPAGTHCGDEKMCVYDLSRAEKKQCIMDSDGNIIVAGDLPCATDSSRVENIQPVYYIQPTPTPTPTPNPDGGAPPRPQGVR